MKLRILDYGAIFQSIIVPDRNGKPVDVLLGYDDVAGYENNGGHLGSTVGRYANRISGASTVIDGVRYELEKNNGENNLHSGRNCTDSKMWTIADAGHIDAPEGVHKTPWSSDTCDYVEMLITCPDMEQGFPGTLSVRLNVRLTEGGEIVTEYHAESDKNTLVNFTNHSYFNLNGEGSGTLDGIKLKICADQFTPVDSGLIPTGELRDVDGTVLDFRRYRELGAAIAAYKKGVMANDPAYDVLRDSSGFDHNFVLNPDDEIGAVSTAADAFSEKTGIAMTLMTDDPGVQLYTGNGLGGKKGKSGHIYENYTGFCLEPQCFPDSANNKAFKQPVFGPGRPYDSVTAYIFTVDKD
jgi:aldose 1-epimerase